jgi:hypothetical protein
MERIMTMLRVWGTLRANRSFYGMTLEEFALRVKPSLDARASWTPLTSAETPLP